MTGSYQARLRTTEREFLERHGVALGERERGRTAIRRHAREQDHDDEWVRIMDGKLRVVLVDVHKAVACEAEAIFKSLERMNTILGELGRSPQVSMTAAREQFNEVFLNIYDVVDGKYRDFGSLAALRKDCKRSGRTFPLQEAKELGARYLLKRVYSGRRNG
jgi:hypothetical protein